MTTRNNTSPPVRFVVDSFFDGESPQSGGPFFLDVEDGRINSVQPALPESVDGSVKNFAFAMPGLVEGHCHLFLDGDEFDAEKRKGYLTAPFETKCETARGNLRKTLRAGITLVHDAGDAYGVNLQMKQESVSGKTTTPFVRTCGLGVRRPGGYGRMIAKKIMTDEDALQAISEAREEADALKVALTGLVNLERGEVVGVPQFDTDELSHIVAMAHDAGLKVHVHVSGETGLCIAVDAGVDFIEHGYFMTKGLLHRMRDGKISWVPTISPFDFFAKYPDRSPFGPAAQSVIHRLVDGHMKSVQYADFIGVNLVAGSDACSMGVDHGAGFLDELEAMLEAGLSMEHVLRSATSHPRKLWNWCDARIIPGNEAELVFYNATPFDDAKVLRKPAAVYLRGKLVELTGQ